MAASIARKTGKVFGIVIAAILILLAALVAYLSFTEYNPPETLELDTHDNPNKQLQANQSIDIVTWNIGYCGLSAQADFFMDGGSGVRTVSREGVMENLESIETKLSGLNPDFIFLQEVDQNSERSYSINERARIATYFAANYSSAYALNYDVAFVPYPVPPIGSVESGIMTLGQARASSAERIQLPCPFNWPVRLGNLKRCLLVERIPIEGSDAELVLVNLHLEAYDDGEGKAAQTAQLARLMQNERAKGNYVIAGGDFNQSFSNVDTSAYPLQSDDLWQCGYLDVTQLGEGFTAVMDATYPTCRSLDRPYDGSSDFQYYMIDGFVVSDNVRIDSLKTIDGDFTFTDHNPVQLSATLL